MALCLFASLSAGCGKPAVPAPQVQASGDTLTLPSAMIAAGHIGTAEVAASASTSLELPGRLVWDEDRTARIYTPVAGRVTAILVQQGDRVAVGQALARISAPDIGSAQADAGKADAALALARKALSRQQDLVAHQVAAQKDLEQSQADAAAAEAEARRAHLRLRSAGAGGDVLDQSLPLRSPVAGVVVERNINPGRELTADQGGPPLFVISDPAHLWLQLDASERDLAALKPGVRVDLRAAQYPDQTFEGTLQAVADFVDPASRTVRVRGQVENADSRLKAEMYISARIALPIARRMTIPATAVFLSGERHYAFVDLGGGRYQRRALQGVQPLGDSVLIQDGLGAGERVVTEGTLYLQQELAAAQG